MTDRLFDHYGFPLDAPVIGANYVRHQSNRPSVATLAPSTPERPAGVQLPPPSDAERHAAAALQTPRHP